MLKIDTLCCITSVRYVIIFIFLYSYRYDYGHFIALKPYFPGIQTTPILTRKKHIIQLNLKIFCNLNILYQEYIY